MQITEWILSLIEQGQAPEEIASQLSARRLSLSQWENLIQKAKEMAGSPDLRSYLLTLFHASRLQSDWLWMRTLGIIAQTPAFSLDERKNALNSIEKKLERLEKNQRANPDAESEAQLLDYSAYLLVLKGSLHAEIGEKVQAKALYRQAREQYQALNNPGFVNWLDQQLALLASEPAPAPERTPAAPGRPAMHVSLGEQRGQVPQPAGSPAATPPPEEVIRKLKDQLAERDRKLAVLANLEKELANLRQQNAKLRADLQASGQELAALRKAAEQPDVRDRDEESDLRQELENKEGEIEDLRETLRKKDQQVIDLQRDLQKQHDQAGQLRRQLQLNQEKIRQLESDLEDSSN